MRRFLAALLAAVFWAPMASAAPAPSYPLTPPPYNSSAKALGSINGQVVNFPLWGIAQTIIYGNPTIGHCSVWVSGPNGLQLGDGSCSGGGGVSSVGLTLPGQFNCTGTPVTGSGTIDCTWGAANANTIFAGPSSGSASTPTFRALTIDDLFGGTGASSSTFLRGDGTWAAAGGGDCTPSASAGDANAPGCIGIPQSGGAFKTANYTTTAADVGGEVVMNCSGACTVTVATNASVPLAVGQAMDITNVGTAADTISSSDTLEAASAGTIVTGSVSLPVGATAFLHKLGATTWLVSGAQGSNLLAPCTVVSGSSTSAVTLAIPASGYINARITFTGYIIDTSAREEAMNILFNSDTTSGDYVGGFYWYTGIYDGSGYQSNTCSFVTGIGACACSPAATESSNTTPNTCTIDIPNYQQTTWPIVLRVQSWMSNSVNSRIWNTTTTWSPGTLAPVTSVTLTANNGGTVKPYTPGTSFCISGNNG